MRLRIALFVAVLSVACTAPGEVPTESPAASRPAARNACEQAFAAAAYAWEDRGEVPDALDLAIFGSCTPQDFAIANERFLITRGSSAADPHPYWNITSGGGQPDTHFYRQQCEGQPEAETLLCRSIAGG